jgi:predicted hydrocarbon binding protein
MYSPIRPVNILETASIPPASGKQSVRLVPEPAKYAKAISAFVYFPKKNFFLLNLEVRNRVGDLAAISHVLAESKIGILNGSFHRGEDGRPGSWEMFVVPQDQNISADEMKRLLTSCPDVLSCQIRESRDGLLVDTLTFPITLSSGERAMIMRHDVWNSMLQKTRQKFGSGGNVIIYDQGVIAGKIAAKELLAAIGKENIGAQINQVFSTYQALGWARAAVLKYSRDPLGLIVRMYENSECTGQQSERPTGHFIRGHIAGMGEEMFNMKVKCEETSCLAMGNDYCDFLLEAI